MSERWTAVLHEPNAGDWLGHDVEDADGYIVASLISTDAHAHLIAAAPDLLDVCKRVLAVCRRHTDGTARMDAAYIDDLKAAIAKATPPATPTEDR